MRILGFCGLALSLSSTVPVACSEAKGLDVPSGTTGGNSAAVTMGGSGTQGSSLSRGGTVARQAERESGGASDASTSATLGRALESIGTATTPASTECAQRQVPIQVLPPDIVIVMDRSMSMTDGTDGNPCEGGDSATGFGNCAETSKWALTIEAIKSVVQDTQSTVNWGMFWLGNEPAQCGASKTPVVPVSAGDSFTAIEKALDSNEFNGQLGTPTAAVINNAVAYLTALAEPNPKYLLIATDGEPNCATNGSGGTAANIGAVDTVGATEAVTSASDAGFPTFVVGIATSSVATASDALNSMAVAGGNAQEGAETQYYAVSDTESLKTVLSQIIGLATSCTISLENAPAGQWTIAIAATNAKGELVELANDASDGWVYTDETTKRSIELMGSSCDKLKSGVYSDLQFVYTCPTEAIVL